MKKKYGKEFFNRRNLGMLNTNAAIHQDMSELIKAGGEDLREK